VLNRYFIFALFTINGLILFWTDPPDAFCLHGTRFAAASGVLVTLLVQLSLILRVYAFWNRNATVLFGLFALLTATNVTGITTLIIAFQGVGPIPKFIPHMPAGCFISPPSIYWAPLVPPLVFDAVIFALTIGRARWLGAGAQTPVITHLLRTGIGYFAVILAVTTFVAVGTIASPQLAVIVGPSSCLAALTSIMCSRLLLYIREELREQKQPQLAINFIDPEDTGESSEMQVISASVPAFLRSAHRDSKSDIDPARARAPVWAPGSYNSVEIGTAY